MKKIGPRSNRDWEEWAAKRRAETPELVTKIGKSRIWIVIILAPALAFLFISTFVNISKNSDTVWLRWFSLLPESIPLIKSIRSFIIENVIQFDIVISIAVVFGFLLGLSLAIFLAYALVKSRFSTLCEAFHIKPYLLPFFFVFSGFLILITFYSGPESISELSKFSRLALGNALELSFYGYIVFLSASGFVFLILSSLQIAFLWFLCILKGE